MNVLIVRHAPAGDRALFAKETGRPDRERPLTRHGRRKFEKCLPGLCRISPKPKRIATSPYTRARETAVLLSAAFPKARLATLAPLAHGGRAGAVLTWLSRQLDGTVALVGHEPDLGRLIGLMTRGRADAAVTLRKGGAALIEFNGAPAAGQGRLVWVLPPAVLKAL